MNTRSPKGSAGGRPDIRRKNSDRAAGRDTERSKDTRPPTRNAGSRRGRTVKSAQARRRTMLLFGGIPLVLVAVIIAVVLVATNAPSSVGLVNADDLYPAASQLSVGAKAPDFTLKTIEGKSYRLSSFKGKPVLLEFFAVWCPVCQAESTILNQIDATYGPKGLQTVAVLANPYGKNYEKSGNTDLTVVTKSDVNWYISNFNVKHPTVIDPTFATVNIYGASRYPGLYLIDKSGTIRYAKAGGPTFDELSSAITPLLT